MGLAILPARLKNELEEIKAYILGQKEEVASYHTIWANELKANYSTDQDINAYVQSALGKKFTRVLEDAGVFKMTPEGIAHFKQFIDTLNK